MSEENTDPNNGGEGEAPTVESLAAALAEKESEIAKLTEKRGIAESHLNKTQKSLSEMQAKFAEIEAAREKANEEAARVKAKAGDTTALEESWQNKYNKLDESKSSEVSQYKDMVVGLTSKAEATKLASKLFGDKADLLQVHVESRIKTEFTEDGPKIRVLDALGQPSALSLDELYEEFKTDDKFAPFVIASKASGGGATGGNKSGGGATQKTMPLDEFLKLPESGRKEFKKNGGKTT